MVGKADSVVVALVAIFILGGCSAAATSNGTPTTAAPSRTASATSTPAKDPRAATTLTLGAAGVQLLNSDGAQVGSFGWFVGKDAAILALTSAFGIPATEVSYPGALESAPGTDYTWGGFVLRVQDFTATPPQNNNLTVLSTSSRVGSVDIRLVNGLTIGSPVTDVVARGPVESFPYTDPATQTGYLFDPVQIDSSAEGAPLLNYVEVVADGDRVVQILAPGKNYGP